jgi:hypothetical protein
MEVEAFLVGRRWTRATTRGGILMMVCVGAAGRKRGLVSVSGGSCGKEGSRGRQGVVGRKGVIGRKGVVGRNVGVGGQ